MNDNLWSIISNNQDLFKEYNSFFTNFTKLKEKNGWEETTIWGEEYREQIDSGSFSESFKEKLN
jgi:hypothetical protein